MYVAISISLSIITVRNQYVMTLCKNDHTFKALNVLPFSRLCPNVNLHKFVDKMHKLISDYFK